ncbi:unnamed protein product [Mycena citricolor]|uniref:Tyr recombinase domain-containing protein n=1 Tax=Mycena citricolor TaxID=2018698 RepID=A0AAD2H302_9AGAR|nr:unnamed protein product [Mycena citricolor]
MEARLPGEKIEYLHKLLNSWTHRTHARLQEVQELTGFLQFASQVIPTARAFLRGLYNFQNEFLTPFSRRRIPKCARRDLAWWLAFSADWNGIRFFAPHRPVIHIYTDASGTKGLGGHFGARWFAAHFPHRLLSEHIQVKEMLAVVHAVLCWGEDFRGSHVVFHIDNEAVHATLNSFSIRNVPTMELFRHFLALSCRLDFSFSSVWLSSKDNSIADAASRFSFTHWWYSQHGGYPQAIAFYLWHGLAPGTRRTYATGQKSFINHCKLYSIYNDDGNILPASLPALMSWVSIGLAGRVQPKTIKQYISHIRSLHVDADLPFSSCESPILQRLIRGIKRFHGERDRKPVQPITLPILTAMLAQLQPGITPGHTTLHAAFTLAYAGFLRSGEITAGSGSGNASLNLKRSNVEFLPNFDDCTHIQLTLPASKTDPFRKGVTVSIAAAPGRSTCPAAALKRMFTEFPCSDNAPLFEGLDGKPLQYKAFVSGLRGALDRAGIKSDDFAGHSFRRGAASEAAAAGFSDYEIQMLGRWRSDCYKLYIENSLSRILSLSKNLHMAHPHSIPYTPPAFRDYAPMA